jgi:hypothetical protein
MNRFDEIKIIVITIAVFMFIFTLPFLLMTYMDTTLLDVDVSGDAILSEYPELECTEKDAEWLETVLQLERTQSVLSSATEAEEKFRLSDTDLEPFYQFPEDDCLISVSKSKDAGVYHEYVNVSFSPIVRDEKILSFDFGILIDADGSPFIEKDLHVYKVNREMSMTYDNLTALYLNIDFGSDYWTKVPGVFIIFGDITICTFKFPRAEVLRG